MQGGEDDLDALLAKFALEDKLQAAVTTEDGSKPPSARVYSSFTAASPQQVNAHCSKIMTSRVYNAVQHTAPPCTQILDSAVELPEDQRPATTHDLYMEKALVNMVSQITCYATLQKESDIILFGGEFLDIDNDKMYVKSELYRFHTADFTWTKLTIPNG